MLQPSPQLLDVLQEDIAKCCKVLLCFTWSTLQESVYFPQEQEFRDLIFYKREFFAISITCRHFFLLEKPHTEFKSL